MMLYQEWKPRFARRSRTFGKPLLKLGAAICLGGVAMSVASFALAQQPIQSTEQSQSQVPMQNERCRAEALTQPYNAQYLLMRRGREHGTASRTLSVSDEGLWRYQTTTEASFLFLSDRRYQDTVFRLQGDQVQPLEFTYRREGTGSNQDYFVTFNYAEQTLLSRGGDPVEAEWREQLLDSNAVLHQLQIDVAGNESSWAYELIDDDGRNRRYEFERESSEVLRLPVGEMETIRVKRVRETDRRETYFWFAPMHNYTLVQMQQIKEGKEQARLVLKQLDRD